MDARGRRNLVVRSAMQAAALRAPIRHRDALAVDRTITLDARQVAALAFREIRAKEAFTILDGDGRAFRASVTTLGPHTGEALVYEVLSTTPESPVHITLFCAVLGRQRMLGVIQKATELGAMAIVPFISARSVQADGLAHEKAHAWPAQALRACRQCRRASVPEVSPALTLAQVLVDPRLTRASLRVCLDDRAPAPRGDRSATSVSHIAFVVGPEGGFTDDERSTFHAHAFDAMRLGGRVLRAETAALVGLTLLQSAYGDLV